MDDRRRISDDELVEIAGGSDGSSDVTTKLTDAEGGLGNPPQRPPFGGSSQKPEDQGGSSGSSDVNI